MMRPIRFLSAGLGGYAWTIAQNLLAASREQIALVAIAEPNAAALPERRAKAQAAGVRIHPDLAAMLEAEPADAVWLPVPIPLHRPFAELAFSRGLHVVCEKPLAGTIDDIDAMIAARNTAGRSGLVGFQDIYLDSNVALKRAILDGAIGTIEHITVSACWPRTKAYYGRNDWAGAARRGGAWVLDSPLQNALAHPVHLALFLAGESLTESTAPLAVEAELYRANPIEHADTVTLRASLAGGATLLVLLTHASSEYDESVVEVFGSKGRAVVDSHGARVEGARPIEFPRDGDKKQPMMRAVAAHLHGEGGVVATFEMARAHALLVNGAADATPVRPIPAEFIDEVVVPDGKDGPRPMLAVAGMRAVMRRCRENRCLPGELGDVPWAGGGGAMSLSDYTSFAGRWCGGLSESA